jgi:hypothetical protein
VQAYQAGALGLALGEKRLYRSATEAEEVGLALSRRAAGVLVYAVNGNPEEERLGRDDLLAAHGDVPSIEF